MDKNRTEGIKHEIKDVVKETVGKVTGNITKQVAGNIKKTPASSRRKWQGGRQGAGSGKLIRSRRS